MLFIFVMFNTYIWLDTTPCHPDHESYRSSGQLPNHRERSLFTPSKTKILNSIRECQSNTARFEQLPKSIPKTRLITIGLDVLGGTCVTNATAPRKANALQCQGDGSCLCPVLCSTPEPLTRDVTEAVETSRTLLHVFSHSPCPSSPPPLLTSPFSPPSTAALTPPLPLPQPACHTSPVRNCQSNSTTLVL